jgi:hypothetical protein
MGKNPGATFAKRARERARQERRQNKEERRAQRRAEKQDRPAAPPGVDPDIAGAAAAAGRRLALFMRPLLQVGDVGNRYIHGRTVGAFTPLSAACRVPLRG